MLGLRLSWLSHDLDLVESEQLFRPEHKYIMPIGLWPCLRDVGEGLLAETRVSAGTCFEPFFGAPFLGLVGVSAYHVWVGRSPLCWYLGWRCFGRRMFVSTNHLPAATTTAWQGTLPRQPFRLL